MDDLEWGGTWTPPPGSTHAIVYDEERIDNLRLVTANIPADDFDKLRAYLNTFPGMNQMGTWIRQVLMKEIGKLPDPEEGCRD